MKQKEQMLLQNSSAQLLHQKLCKEHFRFPLIEEYTEYHIIRVQETSFNAVKNGHMIYKKLNKLTSAKQYHLDNTSTGISYPYLKRNSAASFLACWTNVLASAG